MRHLTLFFMLCSLFSPGRADETAAISLEDSRSLFETAAERHQTAFQEQLDLARLRYAQNLESVRRQAQEAGDLDAVLLIQREQTAAREGGVLEPLPEQGTPEGLRRARSAHDEEVRAAEEELREKMGTLRQNYLLHLQNMQRHYTRANEIEKALTFREEQQRVESGLPAAPGPGPVTEAPEDPATPLFRMQWNRGMPGNQVIVSSGAARNRMPFEHRDGNRITARGYEARGGRTTVPDLAEILLPAFQTSNELSLFIVFETERLDQRGPARILNISRHTGSLNFSLGQQDDKLVVRLRTPGTTNHGTPHLELMPLQPNRTYRLVFTHRSGETRAYVNGEEIDIDNREGDFSNWDENADFVLGNEHTGDRAWRGNIQRFELFNRVLPPDAALRFTNAP